VSGEEQPRIVIREAEPRDVPLLLELFGELAEYEQLTDQLHATPERLMNALFGERPAAEALIAELDSGPAGYALFFSTFSTFLTREGIWLEDLLCVHLIAVRASVERCSRRSPRACLSATAGVLSGVRLTGTSSRWASTEGSARTRWTSGSPTASTARR
jgi:hypothetical protein